MWPSLEDFFGIITKTYLYNFDPLKPHFYFLSEKFPFFFVVKFSVYLNRRVFVMNNDFINVFTISESTEIQY